MDMKSEFAEAAELALERCGETFIRLTHHEGEGNNHLYYQHEVSASVFETTIRHLGAALSIYSQTKDTRFKDCAIAIGNGLLPAFDTKFGLAMHAVAIGTNTANNEGWTGHRHILSEVGSLQLEFRYLTYVSRDDRYANAANRFTEHLQNQLEAGWPKNESCYSDGAPQMPHKGLWPVFIESETGKFCGAAGMASLSDSFYEYLLKQWILFGKTDDHLLEMYEDAVEGILDHLLKYTPKSHLAFVGHFGIGFEPTMDHLACFVPGMLTLGVMHGAHRHEGRSRHWGDNEVITAAADLAATCFRLYAESPSGIGPEIVRFMPNGTYRVDNPKYILRPETIESLFYLYRYTNDKKYRDWAAAIAHSIDQQCRTPAAFAALKDVERERPIKVDSMESFFLAETLKYLYLILEADEGVLDLDRFVLNTEAHPLPIIHDGAKYEPQGVGSRMASKVFARYRASS